MVATMASTMNMAAAILVYFCRRPSMLLALFLPKNVSAPPPIAPRPWRWPSCISTATMRAMEMRISTMSMMMDSAVMGNPP